MDSSSHPPNADPVEPVSSAPGVPLPNPDDQTVIKPRSGSAPPGHLPPGELGKLLAGERLDHFELIEYVGGGGMGAVFRARDTMLGREVALKVLSRDQGNDDETRRRFRNEAQSAARLDHENIARVYYVGEDRGLNYIVFEFILGTNMRDLVEQRGGPLPLAEALSYTVQIARALEHAASREVVHRDIKPSNVLITAEGRAKLVDMGLARLHQVDASRADLTASGVTLGTFDYISPEQARDPRSADVRSDIYSLGCTLYYMLTARPPFPEGTVLQKLLQHNSDDPPDPRELNPTLPPQVSDFMRKMLAKNPRHRFQSPAELIASVVSLAEKVGMAPQAWGLPLPAAAPVAEASLLRRNLPWMVPVAILAGIVVALDLFSAQLPLDEPTKRPGSAPRLMPALPSPARVATTNTREQAEVATIASTPLDETTIDTDAGETQLANAAANNAPAAETHSPAHDIEVLRPGLLVVGDTATGPQRYTSLRAACSAAKNGDVIELRFNGRREERPISLNNVRFTLRAGEGYQPVVVFRPDEIDPVRYPRHMIDVSGGKVTLLNLALELDLPAPEDVPAENWAMFRVERPEALELESCSVTISDQAEQVAFFAVESAVGSESMMAADDAMDEPGNIRLENCILRGEGVVLRVRDAEPVNFTWENGLAITSQRFLVANGAALAPRPGHPLRLALRHVTVVVGQGFAYMANGYDAPYLRDTEIECGDSILLALRQSPLIEQEGVEGAESLERKVIWNGDRNFYDGFDGDAFWRVIDLEDPDQSEELSFLEWISHWGQEHELLPTWGEVAWKKLPPASVPLQRRTSEDYALSERPTENMAREGASDGRDVGASTAQLPRLPASATPSQSPTVGSTR